MLRALNMFSCVVFIIVYSCVVYYKLLKMKIKNKNKCKKKVSQGGIKKRCNYDKDNLLRAINIVKQGESIAAASRSYNVPESTIRAHVKGKYSMKKPGPHTILSETEEKNLVKWIFHCAEQGFPVTKEHLLESVRLLLIELKRENPFTNGIPGRHWYEGFLKRHTNVAKRLTENVSQRRAEVSETDIRTWFAEVKQYLETKNLLNIDNSRVFNCDETSVALNPKSPTVLVQKGTKNVYKIVGNNEKECITVLVTANAAGQLAPTLILFTGQKMPPKVQESLPDGYSDNGWMTAKNFYEYITNIFYHWLVENNIEFPIILFVDGHSSHISLPLSDFCQEKQIELVALRANATHILQPLDVAFFRAFKSSWQQNCMEVCRKNNLLSIKKHQFAEVLKNTLQNMKVDKTLQNGFQTCGLCPFNENAVDYKKVFTRTIKSKVLCVQQEDTSINNNNSEVIGLTCIENMIEKNKLFAFKSYKARQWAGKKEDESLFYIWYDLNLAVNQQKQIMDPNGGDDPNVDRHISTSVNENTKKQTLILDADILEQPLENFEISEKDLNVDGHISIPISEEFKHEIVILDADVPEQLSEPSENSDISKTVVLNLNEDEVNYSESYIDSDIMYHTNNNENAKCSKLKTISDDIVSGSEDTCFTVLNNLVQLNEPRETVLNDCKTCSFSIENILGSSSEVQDVPFNDIFFKDSFDQSMLSSAHIPFRPYTESYILSQSREDIHDNSLVEDITSTGLNPTCNNAEETFVEIPTTQIETVQKINPITPSLNILSEPKSSPLSDVTNSQDHMKLQFPKPFQKVLFWPREEVKKNTNRRKPKRKIPSVLSSEEWKQIKIEEEETKRQLKEDMAMRKKLKLEKQYLKKLKKEQDEIKKKEERLRREELKLQKESDKIKKQEERLKKMEALKIKKEEELRKKQEVVEIRNQLEKLKAKEAELIEKAEQN